jgi:hypothetical protein
VLTTHPADKQRQSHNAKAENHDASRLFNAVNVCADDAASWLAVVRIRGASTYARKYEIKAMKAEASKAPTQSTLVFRLCTTS